MQYIKVIGQLVQTKECKQMDRWMDATKHIISPAAMSINIPTCQELLHAKVSGPSQYMYTQNI